MSIRLLLSIVFLISFTANAESLILKNQYRHEIKQMAVDNHNPNHSYKQARQFIMQRLDLRQDHEGFYVKDVYCHTKFRNKVGPGKMPNHTKINVEHTWPRSRFGGKAQFRMKEADLHHLFPSDSVANSTRGNHIFTQFPRQVQTEYGLSNCPTSKSGYYASANSQAFEPPTDHKGNVARALFYFAVRYDMKISNYEEFVLRQWNLLDPVDRDEILRNDAIADIQGNRNPFVDDSELVEFITDF